MAKPVLVDRELERRHLRVDLNAPTGDAVQTVFAENLVKCVVDVKPADVSVAGPAEVVRLHVVIGDRADRRRPRDETILVVVPARIVEIGQETQLAGVAFPNQILPKNIRDQNLLVAPTELIQVRVGVLLEHVEGGEVVLPAVVVVVAEDADAEVGVVENEAAKIAHERLNANAQRNEIVVIRQVAKVDLAERFLKREEFLFPRCAVLRIRIHHIALFHVEVVVIVNAEKAQRPIDRFEGGLAFEKIDPDGEIVRVKELLAASEKFRAVRALRCSRRSASAACALQIGRNLLQ